MTAPSFFTPAAVSSPAFDLAGFDDLANIFSFFQDADADAAAFFAATDLPAASAPTAAPPANTRKRRAPPPDHSALPDFRFDLLQQKQPQQQRQVEYRPGQMPLPVPKKRCSGSSDDANSSSSVDNDDACGPESSAATATRQHQRRLWVKDRSHDWWDRLSRPDVSDEEFRAEFRMGRATFDALCAELGAAVAKEDTMLRQAIPVRQRVAVCIWRLATGAPLRLVAKQFGLGISTCHKLVLEVCDAIKNVLMPKLVHWPADAAAVARKFEARSGIPNVVGAMYTTHIPIIAPKVDVAQYYNRRHTERNQKTSYSIAVQGVVDADGVFTDVSIGCPGSMSDEQVLGRSALLQQQNTAASGGWVVGGASYPLTEWLLVPYTRQNLTWSQHAFNQKVSEVRDVAREAFRRLKARWGCLQKRTEVKLQDLPVVLAACCVLHNICEQRGERIAVTATDEMQLSQADDLLDDGAVPASLPSVSAVQARDTIAHNLLHGGHAGVRYL